jgi:hypothetical protein
MEEVFDFAHCVDTKREVSFNIESKVNPVVNGTTRGPADFVAAQHAAFIASGYPLEQIQVGPFVAFSDGHWFTDEITVPKFRLEDSDRNAQG